MDVMAVTDYFQGFTRKKIDVGNGIIINTLVKGEGKEALLLLHGHPESYLMWHRTAPALAEDFTVVVTDLRGYGDSSKPRGLPDHSNYSKREMANDQVEVMRQLGFNEFHIAGHDRGGRVCHRMMYDHAEKIKSCTLLDIIPTIDVYNNANQEVATKYWHWFFYIQKEPFPETFLGNQPEFFIRNNILRKTIDNDAFPEDVVKEYIRLYSNPDNVHAIAEDYRASATIDWALDMPDRHKKIDIPIHTLWGSDGNICKIWDVVDIWSNLANNVTGLGVEQCGHFIPEEKPQITIDEIRKHVLNNS